MRKILLVLVSLSFALKAAAIDIVLSDEDLRFSSSDMSESFTVTLADDPTKLAGKSGNIKAKLKYNKKLFDSNLTGPILIPYTDGVVGKSDPVTLRLKDGDSIDNSQASKFSVVVPKGLKKRLEIDSYSNDLNIDAGSVTISGRVRIPTGSSSSFKSRKARVLNPLNTDPSADVEVEVVEIAADGTETPTGIVAVTDSEGNFEIELPPEAPPSVEYAIVAHNQDDPSQNLHAPAVQTEDLVIDPVSEFIHDQLIEGFQQAEDPIVRDNLSSTEMKDIVEQFEEFNPGIEETIEETEEKLADLFAPVIDNMLGVANDEEVEIPDQIPDEQADDDSQEPNDPLTDEDFEFDTTPTELGLAAGELAGDYFVVFYDGALEGSTSANPFGNESRVSAELEIGLARLSRPTEAGVLTVSPQPVLFSEAELLKFDQDGGFGQEGEENQNPDENSGGDDFGQGPDEGFDDQQDGPQGGPSCFAVEAFSETPKNNFSEEGFLATVDTNDVITVVVPATEDNDRFTDDFTGETYSFTFRDKDEVFQFYPVSGGFSVANNVGGGEQFNDATGEKIAEDTILGYQVIIKQSDETLEGLYGIVGVGTDLSGQGRIGVMSLKGTLDISASGAVVYSFDADTELERELSDSSSATCSEDYTVSVSTGSDEFTGPETGTAQFNSKNGRFTIDVIGEEEEEGQMVFEGYGAQDGSIAAFVVATNRNDQGGVARHPNQIDSASRELSFAVRLPESTPSLSGSYKIFSYSTSLSSSGGITLSSHKTGTITFSGTSFSIANTLENQAIKSGPSNSITTTTASSDFEGASGTATIGSTGEISFSAGGHSFQGYVQDEGNAIVVYATDNSNTMGLFLFVKQ